MIAKGVPFFFRAHAEMLLAVEAEGFYWCVLKDSEGTDNQIAQRAGFCWVLCLEYRRF